MIKQVILVRTDLNMRKGKMAAQVAHASLSAILSTELGPKQKKALNVDRNDELLILSPPNDVFTWLSEGAAKIVLGVESEELLVRAYQEAYKAGLVTAIIKDIGKTEFHGVPTLTTVAIGPNHSELIDLITGPSGSIPTKLL